jgi:hypothetical protein
MLAMDWDRWSVIWTADDVAIEGDVAAVQRVLTRPAKDTDSEVDLQNGRIAEIEVKLAPGGVRHARAALRSLPGAAFLIDEDT